MLEVGNLTVMVVGRRLLSDVSFTVDDGEVLSVLGPSGSGKTTLLRALAGLQPISAGDISWDGRPVTQLAPHVRGFGLMFQDYALFPHRTVGENVAFGLRMQKRPGIGSRVTEVLDLVGLAGFGDRPVGSLSGGEQQRVALARALAPEPVLLMLDEPLGALDRALRERLSTELDQLLAEVGITAIYVTHDQEEAFALADRVLVLRDGVVVQTGRPQELWNHPVDAWVADFLGQTNWIEADVAHGVASTSWGRFRVQGIGDGTHRLLVRPEAIHVDAEGPLTGEVLDSRFHAGRWVVTVGLGDDRPLQADMATPPADGRVRFRIDADGVTTLR